jgi:hypothetical protein
LPAGFAKFTTNAGYAGRQKQMSDRAEAYMVGWRAGYHNSMLAERKRILEILKVNLDKEVMEKLKQLIETKEG